VTKRKVVTQDEWEAAGRREREQMLAASGPPRQREPHKDLPIVGPGYPWDAIARFVLRDGRPVIKELRILYRRDAEWDMPPSGLTADHLRRIRMGVSQMHVLAAWAFHQAGVKAPPSRRTVQPKHQRGTDDFYAEKANEYLEALARDARRPREWIVQQYRQRGQQVKNEQVRDWVHRARARGFLTAAEPGRAGAKPTDKLREWNAASPKRRRRSRPKGKG
jgi:hypothetical protein